MCVVKSGDWIDYGTALTLPSVRESGTDRRIAEWILPYNGLQVKYIRMRGKCSVAPSNWRL